MKLVIFNQFLHLIFGIKVQIYILYTNKYFYSTDMSIPVPDNLTLDQKYVFKKLYKSFNLKNNFEILTFLDEYFINDISNEIYSYLTDENIADRCAIIGGAGMGKTYLMCQLIRTLDEKSKICVITPTHKAKGVIMNSLHEINKNNILDIEFMTISKFLNKKTSYDKDGKIRYSIKYISYNTRFSHIIIDEMSMISKEDCSIIGKIMKKNLYTFFCFMGDNCQLPPINEKESKSFNMIKYKFNLKTVIRTNNPELKKAYSYFRNNVILNKKPINFINQFKAFRNVKIISKQNRDFFLKRYFNKDSILLAWRNKTVDSYNNLIRKKVFKFNKTYQEGTKLIFKDFCNSFKYCHENAPKKFIELMKKPNLNLGDLDFFYLKYSDILTSFDNSLICNKMDDLIIKSSEKSMISGYKIHIITSLTSNVFYKIDKSDQEKFTKDYIYWKNKIKRILLKCKNQNQINTIWNMFFRFVKYMNCPLDYGYSVTIHKSQGSTYSTVFIDTNDFFWLMNDNLQEYNKLMYTAVSRSKNKIIFINK